jgi:hypothetical protein
MNSDSQSLAIPVVRAISVNGVAVSIEGKRSATKGEQGPSPVCSCAKGEANRK